MYGDWLIVGGIIASRNKASEPILFVFEDGVVQEASETFVDFTLRQAITCTKIIHKPKPSFAFGLTVL